MLCENCKKNEATTYIKTVINGEVSEKHLCSECAAAEDMHFGYNTMSSMLTSIFGNTARSLNVSPQKRCKCCNSSFSDIVKTGRLGCSECYETFFDELLPYLKRIHGSVRHTGKVLCGADLPQSRDKEDIAALEAELKKMIESENFEQAAQIRDKIKLLRGEEK